MLTLEDATTRGYAIDPSHRPGIVELAFVVSRSYGGSRMIPNPHDSIFNVLLRSCEHAHGVAPASFRGRDDG